MEIILPIGSCAGVMIVVPRESASADDVSIRAARHTGFSSRPTARTSEAYFDSSTASCFFPAAVR
jgi:hypothetical protein